MEGLSEDTFVKSFAKHNSQSLSFRHHETIRIKENLDTQASSLRCMRYYFTDFLND